MIILINAMPGVGKLTVATALQNTLKQSGKTVYLIDNHAIINLITTFTERGSDIYVEAFMKLNQTVFGFLEKAPKEEIFIFTNALAENLQEDIDRYKIFPDLAEKRHDKFIPICLVCDLNENVRRLQTPSRADKQKLIDPDIFIPLAKKHGIYYDDKDSYGLKIDTTSMSAEDVALEITRHIKQL